MGAADLLREWRKAVHEHHCGAPLSCGDAKGCEGLPGGVEEKELRRLLRGKKVTRA